MSLSGEHGCAALSGGIRLRLADNKTGYEHVVLAKPGQPKPFYARVWHNDKRVHLGSFVTAEEAAVCVAWWMEEPKAAAEKAAVTSWHQDMPSRTWREVDAGGAGRHGAASSGGWCQDAKGMWHEKESMLELQAAGLAEEGIAQLEEKIEARQHGTGYLGAHLNGRQPGKLSPAGSCEPQVRRAGSVVNLGRHATTEQTMLWRAQQEESGRAQDSVLGGAQEGSRSAKRARHAYPEVRPHHRLYHHLLPEELSSNLLPEGCATNVDSTWNQGLDLSPALGGAASQGRAVSQGGVAFHAPARVFEGGVVSQEQHEAALAAARALSTPLRRRLEKQAAAAETELRTLSFAHAVQLREAREQHERSAIAAQQQHGQTLAALQKQLAERKAAAEKALLEASASKAAALTAVQENEKLRAAVASANLRAGEAEVRAGEAEVRAGEAEARAALAFTESEPPWVEAKPEPPSPPPECSSASSSGDSGASRSDVEDSGDVGDSEGDNNNNNGDNDNNGSMRDAGQ